MSGLSGDSMILTNPYFKQMLSTYVLNFDFFKSIHYLKVGALLALRVVTSNFVLNICQLGCCLWYFPYNHSIMYRSRNEKEVRFCNRIIWILCNDQLPEMKERKQKNNLEVSEHYCSLNFLLCRRIKNLLRQRKIERQTNLKE